VANAPCTEHESSAANDRGTDFTIVSTDYLETQVIGWATTEVLTRVRKLFGVARGCNRAELTDAQWAHLARCSPQRSWTGRPARDHRTVLSAILWVLARAPWRDLPERFGPWFTAWSASGVDGGGVWQRVLEALQGTPTATGA
jgi:transposase